jgi:hypothetical protein
MKKIILFLVVILSSLNSYSQKQEGDTWRQVAKYLFDEGFDRDELRSTVQLVRDMSREVFEKKKISKKTEKKLKNLSFSEDQIETLKTLSKKMSKVVTESMKNEKNEIDSFDNNNQDRFNRARGDFNQNRRGSGANSRAQGGQGGGQRAGSNNRQGPPRPEVNNPVMQRLMQYVREQGVSGKNIRDVMSVIMQIGREYKASSDRGSYKPSDESVAKLKDAGLNDETVKAVIEVIKALAVYDK